MAKTKQVKDTKPSKEGSKLFHDIMGAAVKGNPKPKEKPTSEKETKEKLDEVLTDLGIRNKKSKK